MKISDVTATLVCAGTPKKLLKILKTEFDYEILQKYDGIYYIIKKGTDAEKDLAIQVAVQNSDLLLYAPDNFVKKRGFTVKERTLVSFDYAVKYLLRGKTASDMTILGGFLTELMGRRIDVVDILESESNKVDADAKINISTTLNGHRVDLKARIDGGEFAVFEIQFLQAFDFFGKVLFGVSRAIVEQVTSGKFYGIEKVHSINIAYYNMTAKREYLFHGKFSGFRGVHFENETIPFAQAVSPDTKELVVDIHPEYYLILPNMFDEELRGKFDEWVYVLKTSKIRDDFTASGIQEAKIRLDYLSMSAEERRDYERYMENRSCADSVALTAEQKGLQKGLQEGLLKGRQEQLRKDIISMHQEGLGVEAIARISELSEDEVKTILGL